MSLGELRLIIGRLIHWAQWKYCFNIYNYCGYKQCFYIQFFFWLMLQSAMHEWITPWRFEYDAGWWLAVIVWNYSLHAKWQNNGVLGWRQPNTNSLQGNNAIHKSCYWGLWRLPPRVTWICGLKSASPSLRLCFFHPCTTPPSRGDCTAAKSKARSCCIFCCSLE